MKQVIAVIIGMLALSGIVTAQTIDFTTPPNIETITTGLVATNGATASTLFSGTNLIRRVVLLQIIVTNVCNMAFGFTNAVTSNTSVVINLPVGTNTLLFPVNSACGVLAGTATLLLPPIQCGVMPLSGRILDQVSTNVQYRIMELSYDPTQPPLRQ